MNEKLSTKELFWIWLTLGLGILIYGYSLTNGFIWDDSNYLLQNPSIASLPGLAKIWTFPTTAFCDNPLTLSVFWLGHKLWGFSPWGYHTLSLTLHMLNALLLFGLVRRFAPILAGITALLFTIHPIQVETVAWISELKNILCLFFFLGACHSFLDFDKSSRKKSYLKTLLFFTASLLSKPTGICFAAAPLLYAWHKKGAISKRTVLLTLPFIFLGLSNALIPMIGQNISFEDQPMPLFPENFIFAGKAFLFYIKQILLPWRFLFLYPQWDISIFRMANWLYPAGVILLYAALYKNRHRWGRSPFALLCFYGISIFPALGFLKITFFLFSYVADHFSYLSVPSLLLLFCIAGRSFLSRIKIFLTRKSWAPSLFLIRSTAIVFIAYLAVLSFYLTLNYKNSGTLWLQLLIQTPESPWAYHMVGAEIMRADPKKAVPFLKKAITYNPDPWTFYEGLGVAYMNSGETQKAVQAFQEGVRRHPKNERARNTLVLAQADLEKEASKTKTAPSGS